MQIKNKYFIFFTIGILTVFLASFTTFFILFPTSSVFAVEATKSKSNDLLISVNPSKELFRVKNMAPGNKSGAPMTVMNTGKKDFYYDISAQMESGDMLYNELDLTITDQKGKLLYAKKLKDLKNLELGKLNISQNETFNISVGLPIEAGNEYQGIHTSVKFVLTAHTLK